MCAASPHIRFGSPACQACCWDIHSFDVLNRLALRLSATMASADFSQFVVTTAIGAACETSRDKSRTFPRLPARFTRQGYGCLLDFAVHCQLVRLTRLGIGFLSVRPRFRYPFFPPKRRHLNLGIRYRVRRQLRPLGLPPKLRDMPVIQQKSLKTKDASGSFHPCSVRAAGRFRTGLFPACGGGARRNSSFPDPHCTGRPMPPSCFGLR